VPRRGADRPRAAPPRADHGVARRRAATDPALGGRARGDRRDQRRHVRRRSPRPRPPGDAATSIAIATTRATAAGWCSIRSTRPIHRRASSAATAPASTPPAVRAATAPRSRATACSAATAPRWRGPTTSATRPPASASIAPAAWCCSTPARRFACASWPRRWSPPSSAWSARSTPRGAPRPPSSRGPWLRLGSYETGFWEDDSNHTAWDVPNVLLAVPRVTHLTFIGFDGPPHVIHRSHRPRNCASVPSSNHAVDRLRSLGAGTTSEPT
jgi:hypothetical protein